MTQNSLPTPRLSEHIAALVTPLSEAGLALYARAAKHPHSAPRNHLIVERDGFVAEVGYRDYAPFGYYVVFQITPSNKYGSGLLVDLPDGSEPITVPQVVQAALIATTSHYPPSTSPESITLPNRGWTDRPELVRVDTQTQPKQSADHWIQTLKGRKFDLLEPDPAALDIEEIAHSLSMLCRFTGHTKHFMSVAQHSVIVADLVEKMGHHQYIFDALMHDATEAYVGDVSRPLKRLLPDYARIEQNIAGVISKRFGVSNPLPHEVKVADNISLLWERRDLMDAPLEGVPQWIEEWALDLIPKHRLIPVSNQKAEREFLAAFSKYSPSKN